MEQALKSQVSSYKEEGKNEFIDPQQTKIPIMMITSPEEHHAFLTTSTKIIFSTPGSHLLCGWNIGWVQSLHQDDHFPQISTSSPKT